MRLKTFFTAYLLLIFILFMTVSSISIYMINNQMSMLKEKNVREYQNLSIIVTKEDF